MDKYYIILYYNNTIFSANLLHKLHALGNSYYMHHTVTPCKVAQIFDKQENLG